MGGAECFEVLRLRSLRNARATSLRMTILGADLGWFLLSDGARYEGFGFGLDLF
jgi:hypothetical protein